MAPELIRIPIPERGMIEASLWSTANAKGIVLLHPATAVTERYYEPFARYLLELGFSVITYDYRGTAARVLPVCTGSRFPCPSGWMKM